MNENLVRKYNMMKIIKNTILTTVLLLEISGTQAMQTLIGGGAKRATRPIYTTVRHRDFHSTPILKHEYIQGIPELNSCNGFTDQIKKINLPDLRTIRDQAEHELGRRLRMSPEDLNLFQGIQMYCDKLQNIFLPTIHENVTWRDGTLGALSQNMSRKALDLVILIDPYRSDHAISSHDARVKRSNIKEILEDYKSCLFSYHDRISMIVEYGDPAYRVLAHTSGEIYEALASFEIFWEFIVKYPPLRSHLSRIAYIKN
jgi:hypothetical protein